MNLQLTIAYLHLLTLCIGFYSIWARADALKRLNNTDGLPDVFKADNFWGLAALLWIGTGLLRAFAGLEKGTAYYLHSTAFIIKMCLFLLVFIIELKPMITLIQWRIKNNKNQPIDLTKARTLSFLSHIELGLLSIIVLFAVAMARGVWS